MPRKEKEQLDRAALDGRIQRAASEKGGELVLCGNEYSDDPVSFDAAELAAALGAGGEAARALTALDVDSNRLGEAGMAALAAALAGGACPGLTALNARSNELTSFPEALCGVESLEELNLVGNDIDRLPWGLLHLRRLRKLRIKHNPRLRQEYKLLGDKNDNVAALFGYLRDLYGGGEQPARRYRFKLVLAGPTMAGKTSLAAALREGERARLADADTGRTIGLAIKELRMRDPRVRGGGGGLLRGNIFDAGGHEQCVPAGPSSAPLCVRFCLCCLPHVRVL
jgi:hypothetical protein